VMVAGGIVAYAAGHVYRRRVTLRTTAVHHYAVFQSSFFPQYTFDGLTQEFHIMLFQPFVEKLAGYLERKNITLQRNCFNWFEPCLKSAPVYIILYYFHATAPYCFCVVVRHIVGVGIVNVFIHIKATSSINVFLMLKKISGTAVRPVTIRRFASPLLVLSFFEICYCMSDTTSHRAFSHTIAVAGGRNC